MSLCVQHHNLNFISSADFLFSQFMSFYLHHCGRIFVSEQLQIKENLVRNVFAAAKHQFLFLSNKWKLRRETSNLYFQPQQISNKRMGWEREGKYNIYLNFQVNIQAEGKKWLIFLDSRLNL